MFDFGIADFVLTFAFLMMKIWYGKGVGLQTSVYKYSGTVKNGWDGNESLSL
jgi:hypothetical protein